MKKEIRKSNTTNQESALWRVKGFSIYKDNGTWNYSNGTYNNWEVDGQPFDTRKECIAVLEENIRNGIIK